MQELLTCKEYWLLNLCSFQNRWAQNTQNSEEEKKTQKKEFTGRARLVDFLIYVF
jgi:hypothetical protein